MIVRLPQTSELSRPRFLFPRQEKFVNFSSNVQLFWSQTQLRFTFQKVSRVDIFIVSIAFSAIHTIVAIFSRMRWREFLPLLWNRTHRIRTRPCGCNPISTKIHAVGLGNLMQLFLPLIDDLSLTLESSLFLHDQWKSINL